MNSTVVGITRLSPKLNSKTYYTDGNKQVAIAITFGRALGY